MATPAQEVQEPSDPSADPFNQAPDASTVKTPEGFTGEVGNANADLALLQEQLEGKTSGEAVVEPVVEPSEVPPTPVPSDSTPHPETVQSEPESKPQTVEGEVLSPPEATEVVPDKFKNPDGTVNEAKVQMSTAHALARFNQIEAAMHKSQSDANQAGVVVPKGVPVQAEVDPANYADPAFSAQLDTDIAKYGLGAVMAKMADAVSQRAAKEARDATLADVSEIRQEHTKNKQRREIENIVSDPFFATGEGIEALHEIKKSDSKMTWGQARDQYYINWAKEQRAGQGVKPNPTGVAVRPTGAPVTPPVVPKPAVKVNEQDPVALEKYLATLDTKAQNAYWASKGLPPMPRMT